nr:MAG TPA: hypothetical protein [Caudoviricetes sp.]
MAYQKRTWVPRLGTGLNKFSIDGATPVTIVNSPDEVSQNGDELTASALNNLEDRIYNAVTDVEDAVANGFAGIKALTDAEIDSVCQ